MSSLSQLNLSNSFGNNFDINLNNTNVLSLNNGNVCIGTNTIGTGVKLDVNGTVRAFIPGSGSSSLVMGGTTLPGYLAFNSNNGTRLGYVGWGDGSNYLLLECESTTVGYRVYNNGAGGNFIVDGNVGIGSSPSAKLHIVETIGTATGIGITNGANLGSIIIDHNNSGGASSITFRSTVNRGSDYAYVQYLENVVSTSYNYFGGSGNETGALILGCENDASTSGPDSVIITPAGNIALVPKNGITYISSNVGIGITNPSPPYALTVNSNLFVIGTIYSTGDIAAFYSDDRLKTKLGNITNSLNIINNLSGFKFRANEIANSYGINNDNIEIGLSAQEIQKVLPEIVSIAPFDREEVDGKTISKSGKNFLTVKYDKLIPVLIESIKELTEKINNIINDKNKIIENLQEQKTLIDNLYDILKRNNIN